MHAAKIGGGSSEAYEDFTMEVAKNCAFRVP